MIDGANRMNFTRNRKFFIGGLVALVIVLGLAGLLMANHAASQYEQQRAKSVQALKPLAKQAATINFADIIVLNDVETPEQLVSEQTQCNLINSLDKSVTKYQAPQLSVAFPGNVMTFLSGNYKHARDQQKSDTIAAQQKVLAQHLASLGHACTMYTKMVTISQQDVANSAARSALIIENGQDGILCNGGAATCLPNASALAFKALEPTEIAQYQQTAAAYAKDCYYPLVKDVCKAEVDAYKEYNPALQAYVDALSPDGGYDDESVAIKAVSTKFEPAECAALKKDAPAIAKMPIDEEVGCEAFAVHYLMQQDDQAITTAAAKLLAAK
jgi:hypothetical protein